MPTVSSMTAVPAYAPGDAVYLVTAGGLSRKLVNLRVANIAAMTAIAVPTNGMSVEVTEEGRGGFFVFDTSVTASGNGGTTFSAGDATSGSWVRRYDGAINLRWFNPTADGVTDDAPALQAALDAAYAQTAGTQGGGEVYIPAGVYGISAVSIDIGEGGNRQVNIRGAGKVATVLQKVGATTTPVISLMGFEAVTIAPSGFVDLSDFTIVGNAKAHPGIRLSLQANFTISRVGIFTCSTAVDLIGSLVGSLYDCQLTANVTGIMTRKFFVSGYAGDGIYANLVRVDNCTINSNTSWGIDLGEAAQFILDGTTLERNGTLGNPATGAMIIRDTVDNENPFMNISVQNCWFESNKGRLLEVEAAAGLALYLSNCHSYTLPGEGGEIINVGAIRFLYLVHWKLHSAGSLLTSAATRTVIIGERPTYYTDNSSTTVISSSVSSVAMLLEAHASFNPGAVADYSQLYIDGDNLKLKDPSGGVKKVAFTDDEIVITTNVITAEESGKTFYLYLDDGFTSTLPAPALGLKYTFIVRGTPNIGGTGYVITTDGGANVLYGRYQDVVGEMVAFSEQDTITFVGGTSIYGDRLEVVSDGLGWHCQAFSSVDGGIAVSVT